jgi:uncharacterized phage-associated protein
MQFLTFGNWMGASDMAETASNIAKHILARFNAKGAPINNVKLQKLLYYTQAWHLAHFDTPLFADPIEAWVHGPVIPAVFREYKYFRWSPITASVSYQPSFNVAYHVDHVLSVYGDFSSWDLERMTHNESPWKEARAGLAPDVPSTAIISHESMKTFYSAL